MQEPVEDYYLVLGVPRHTLMAGIRRAYLKKAREIHPDVHPDDPDAESKMAALNLAYDTLCDPIRRARYDSERQHAKPQVSKAGHGWDGSSAQRMRHRRNPSPSLFAAFSSLVRRAVRIIAALLPD